MNARYRPRLMLSSIPSALALATACCALGACSYQILTSERVTASATAAPAEPGGLVYSLPKTIVTVQGAIASGVVTYTLTPSIVPDPKAKFRVRYTPPGSTDDDINVQVDSNGLLTSSSAKFVDRSGDIITALAKTAAAAAGLRAEAAGAAKQPEAMETDYPFQRIYEAKDLVAGQELPDGARLTIDSAAASALTDRNLDSSCATLSLCYRSVFPVIATIKPKGSNKIQYQFAFMAVDPNSLEGITIKSAPLVARQNTAAFSNGLLTTLAVNQPSTGLAIASLPLSVAQAVVTSLFTLRISYLSQEQALVTAQDSFAKAQTALIATLQALQNARNPPSTGSPNTPKAVTGTGSAPQ